jgi:hypothetical protein
VETPVKSHKISSNNMAVHSSCLVLHNPIYFAGTTGEKRHDRALELRTDKLNGNYTNWKLQPYLTSHILYLQVDLFSLGMTIYEIISGHHPLDNYHYPGQVIQAIRKGERPSLKVRKGISSTFD